MSIIRFNKSVRSYGKVQKVVEFFIRNKKFQLKKQLDDKQFLDVGCGPNTHNYFINLDYSWTSQVDLCWDITKGNFPFPENRFEGIYTEHCLEHIKLDECEKCLQEFYRMLKKGGVLRIVVPDGELYFDIYQKKKNNENIVMPWEENYISPMARINGLFRNHGHKFIYDFYTFKILLERNGFKNITKQKFKVGLNPKLLIDTEERKIESLYIEAVKI